jgi:hypothetical protein
MEELEINDDVKKILRDRQNELISIIEAFGVLEGSKEWQTIKEFIYDKSLAGIERQILNESLRVKIDENKLYKLQGEWAWSKQFSDTNQFVSTLKKQLEDIKLKLK